MAQLSVNVSDSDSKEIYYERSLETWVVGPSLKFYEETIFALSTFCTAKNALIRATNATPKCFAPTGYTAPLRRIIAS